MVKSANLGLPFVEAAQAQKHVTVNESLVRLDAVAQLVVQSGLETTPPSDAEDGMVFAVPQGAQSPWNAAVGQLAVRSNGGWEYIAPQVGWRAWFAEDGTFSVFDGSSWMPVHNASSQAAIGTALLPIEFDHEVLPGGAQPTSIVIPAQSSVVGVTGRVVDAITGSLSSWRLGADGSDNRYGSGFGTVSNSFMRGLTGSPLTYYSDTPLILTPEAGSFGGGVVRLIVHTIQLGLPDPV